MYGRLDDDVGVCLLAGIVLYMRLHPTCFEAHVWWYLSFLMFNLPCFNCNVFHFHFHFKVMECWQYASYGSSIFSFSSFGSWINFNNRLKKMTIDRQKLISMRKMGSQGGEQSLERQPCWIGALTGWSSCTKPSYILIGHWWISSHSSLITMLAGKWSCNHNCTSQTDPWCSWWIYF